MIPGTTQFWTPHSGRAFLPSATAMLGFEKTDRDFPGGWTAQGSDRYARVSRTRIQNMQKAAVRTAQEQADGDPLGEGETRTQFESYLLGLSVPVETQNTYLEKLANKSRTICLRNAEELQLREVAEPVDEVLMDAPDDLAALRRIDKRKVANVTRTSILGKIHEFVARKFEQDFLRVLHLCIRQTVSSHLALAGHMVFASRTWITGCIHMRARNFLPKPRTTSFVRSLQKRGWLVH